MKKYIKFIAIGTVVILLFLFWGDIIPKKQAIINSNEEKSIDQSLAEKVPDTTGISIQIFSALGEFYLASEKDISNAEANLLSINSSLMEQNRFLISGINNIRSLTSHENQIVKLASMGMVLGATQIINANNELIDFFRTADQTDPKIEQEATYRLSDYISKTKEGYKNIFISAPQIGYLYFNSATSEKPTGPISYKISQKEREVLLEELDNRFGDYIKIDDNNYQKTKTHNAILLAAKQLLGYLKFDTYEEISN